jgi:hypothetical protein
MLLDLHPNPSEFKRGYVKGIQAVSEHFQDQLEAEVSAYEISQGM